jgi:hypothetical protein
VVGVTGFFVLLGLACGIFLCWFFWADDEH